MNSSLLIAVVGDLLAIFVLAYVVYFRRHRRRDLLLAYVALNVGIMAVTVALGSVEAGVGLGMGLFGILSIIRLRSDQITQQEIAYYFTSLALGLLAGLHPDPAWIAPALSAVLVAVIAIVDSPAVHARTRRHNMTLDRAYTEESSLKAALSERLGATIHRVEVLDVDLVRDVTVVDVRYSTDRPTRRTAAEERMLRSGGRHAHDEARSAELAEAGSRA